LEGIFIASETARIPLATDVHRLGQLSWLLLLLVIVTMPNWLLRSGTILGITQLANGRQICLHPSREQAIISFPYNTNH
jgi:hypothetical protein